MMSKNKANENSKVHPYYTLKRRVMVVDSRVYKLKDFDDEHILFSACETKCVVKTDIRLKKVVKTYEYDDTPSALDVVALGEHKFLVVGFHKGHIVVRTTEDAERQQLEKNDDEDSQHEWKFKPNVGENITNDIAHHPEKPNIVVSCYNNGSIAVFGLLKNRRLHTFQRVHEKYTYKLRFQSSNILVSCGADCSVVRTDFQKQKYLSVFNHSLPVWCAHPIDKNQIASVGLFGRVLIWDVRANRLVQFCNNSGNESSFITQRCNDQHQLFYGDSTILVKWDRRKAKPELFSNHNMQVSSQGMLFKDDSLYICGRGKDLCFLKSSETLQNLNDEQLTKNTGKFKIKYKSNKQQIEEQQNDDNFYQMSDQEDEQDEQSLSEQSIHDETQPLIKSSKQMKIKKTIDVVAEIKLLQLKKLRQHEQTFSKNKTVLDSEQSSSEDQTDKNLMMAQRKKKSFSSDL